MTAESVRSAGAVVFPGSFDPVTRGHLDLIGRALSVFGALTVAVADDPPGKKPLFPGPERVAMIREATAGLQGVEVDLFRGVLVDYLRARGARTVVRGLRSGSDFDWEARMALTNRKMAPEIDTVFLLPGEEWCFLSSSLVRELAGLGADVSCFVPDAVRERLKIKSREGTRPRSG